MDIDINTKDELLTLAEELEVEVKSKKKGKPTKAEIMASIEAYAAESKDNTAEVDELYIELFGEDVSVVANENIYTYVGGGESSPIKIKFMGKQEFIRGRATEVTDPIILAKIINNHCFIKGEVKPEALEELQDVGIEIANKNRKADKAADEAFKKQHGGKE